MRKLFVVVAVILAAGALVGYGQTIQTITRNDADQTGLRSFASKVNSNFTAITNQVYQPLDADLTRLAVNNGASLTNLAAGELNSGTVPNARLDSDLQALAINNGGALTNLNAANVSGTYGNASINVAGLSVGAGNLILGDGSGYGSAVATISAAKLTAGTTANAVDLSTSTNLPAAGIALADGSLIVGDATGKGSAVATISAQKLTAATLLPALAATALTNIPAANLFGTVPIGTLPGTTSASVLITNDVGTSWTFSFTNGLFQSCVIANP